MFKKSIAFVSVLSLVLTANMAFANHSWGNYHWARSSNPFTLKLGDNVSNIWDSTLATTSSDWSQSAVLDTTVVSGLANPKNCRATMGRVEVCSSNYGNNGWLGIASVWANGDHIVQGTVKVNDTYFKTAKYNTPAWRNLVMCQEVGHTFGLDHQDENFDNPNLGTCMDYTNDPSSNQHPNQHDYDQLEAIYSHLDSSTTVGQTTSGSGKPADMDGQEVASWGKSIRSSADGRSIAFERDLANGQKIFTFVVWAE